MSVVRGGLARRHVGGEGFRWRGKGGSRIEGFSDAVFAFAVTLLVVSLEVPKTFEELISAMRGFFAFAICFALLFFVWYDHYKFFVRYGLSDRPIVWLNGALLFIVLFYVYPMKFLFTLLTDQLLGFSQRVRLPSGVSVEMIEPSQGPALMMVYGGGFVALQLVFVSLYWRAYSLRDALDLDAYELSVTREEIQGFLLNVFVGLSSVTVAVVGGPGAVSWAGAIYILIFPLQVFNGRAMASRREKQGVTAGSAGGEGEARED
ncbi:MAG: TMEM175 family protein [Rubrobacter sp.]